MGNFTVIHLYLLIQQMEEAIMANNKYVYQQVNNVSVPKKELREYVAYNQELTKKDYKVFLMLLTELNGYDNNRRYDDNYDAKDPMNFTKIDAEQIAKRLDMSKSDVKKSIKTLLHEGIIEKGDTSHIKNGYRFTF